jgi:hypothetical protein
MTKNFGFAAVLFVAMAFTSIASADLLDDGDFEGAAWTTFGNAFQDDTPAGIDPGVEGAQSLKMFGNFTGGENFTGAFQDVAVDGTDFSVGDIINVTGLIGHQGADALMGGNRALLEITFVDTDGGLGEFGFGANPSADLTAASGTDQYFMFQTTAPIIPVEAEFIRVKAVFIQQADNAGGAAFVENVALNNLGSIPEPGSASVLALGMLGLFMKRRRK